MAIAVQVVGAVAILAAFTLVQRGTLSTRSVSYLVLNLAGGLATAAVAYVEEQWGFVVLQSVWALVAAWGLAGVPRSGARTGQER
ncbi:MAG TPA: hypothetical protein VLD16_06395 [Gaiellaceae bacterium]|nr:hypothetical protein [Gaiellaceae bacterium]